MPAVSANQSTPKVKRKTIQPDLPGTISGASNPEAIPDTIAYELFLRSIADYRPEAALKDTGLNDDQIVTLLSYIHSFEAVIGTLDYGARHAKTSGRGVDRLGQLQKQREQYLDRELGQHLPRTLGVEAGNKIRSYLNRRVTPKTKKLPVRTGGAYVYSNAWSDGENIYGSGTIYADYGDYNQYLVTTTVSSPNGSRWSTSQTGWDYASITDTEYLPIMPNGGTFTVESVFEGDNVYLASATNSATVTKVASIVLAQATPLPPQTVAPPTTNSNSSAQITAQISFSDDTIPSDYVEVELMQAANMNLVDYTVGGNTGDGTTKGNSNRVVTSRLVQLAPARSTGPSTYPLPAQDSSDRLQPSATLSVSIISALV